MLLVRFCLLLLAGLAGSPALAASYVFPGAMPAGCSGSAGVYRCSALTLAAGDSIAITGSTPATITINGNFAVGNASINSAGSVGDLNLIVAGNFACGLCQVNASVTVGGQTSHGGYIGGSLTATAGSVLLSGGSVVAGNVTTQNKNQTITLDSSQARVGGCLTVNTNSKSAIFLGDQASAGGVCCSPGNSGCKTSCVTNDSGDAMPPLCTAMPPPAPAVDGFSAIDSAYASTSPNFLTGHIYGKVAGIAFPLKVAAIYNNLIQTTYASDGNKSVTIKLVDNSDGLCGTNATRRTACAACNGRSAVSGGSQTLSFTASDGGVRTSANFTLGAAYPNLVAVISDGSVTACSPDSFSVRPDRVSSVGSSAGNASLSGLPLFRAGSDSFTLSATVNAGNYSGVLKINSAAMRATGADWTVGAISPDVFPGATGGATTSTASGTTFTYAEVGNFAFRGFDPATDSTSPRGIYDDTWTAIDSAQGDCVADSYANVANATGLYGCSFGLFDGGAAQPDSGLFGRFVPDHFAYAGGGLAAFCSTASAFTYMGQPALGIAYRLLALNGASPGAVTRNYSQALTPPYPVVAPSLVAEDQASAHQACNLAGRFGNLPTGQWLAGIFALNDANADNLPDTMTASFSRPAVPLTLSAASCTSNRSGAGGPFWQLDIGVAINDVDVAAGLSGADMNPDSAGSCAGAACSARRIGGTAVVYGRLWLNSAYGSEMLPLAVPVRAQYWTTSGWLNNGNDSCSALVQPTRQDTGNGGLVFYASGPRNALAPGEVVAQMGGSTASPVKLLAGDARLVLRHPNSDAQGPGSGNAGYVDVMGSVLSPGSWLPASANARACFGACGPRSPVIYYREMY